MIVVKLMGGMGNQMFQYACGKALSIKHGVPLILDHSYLERKQPKNITKRNYELSAFGIELKASKYLLFKIYFSSFLTRILSHKFFYKIINEISPYEANTKFPYYNNLIINGYFQSEQYFLKICDIIRSDFIFTNPNPKYNELINFINSLETPVSVLVRRDDYINLSDDSLLSIEYYNESIDYISSKVQNPCFLVFTIGDTAWVKENLKSDKKIIFIENENPDLKGFEKMRLMSLCKHNIIANSSFGWWSAWLNSFQSKIVVAPQKWSSNLNINTQILKNRLPKTWIIK